MNATYKMKRMWLDQLLLGLYIYMCFRDRGFRQNGFRQNLDFVLNWILPEWILAEWI
jgi:hypothetical protein